MGRRRPGGWLVPAVLTAGVVVLPGGTSASADDARPTVDMTAPTPTAPYPGGPPQGHAPDGSTVGGEELDTRGTVVADGAPALPDGVAASGWLVADAGTGDVLAARDPHGRYYPASTLKTLTLLTLAPLLDPAEVVIGTTEDENIEGSRVGLVQGGRYPVSLLFEALILQSGNDAANALARAAGGVELTVEAMNETAQGIGAYDTVAGTPSGLDVAGQSSTPYDLALIFRELIADADTAAVLATPTAQMPPVPDRSPGYQIQSQNPLLTTYEGDLGAKTGFTDAARHTFVTAAERNGRRLVVSLMDTENAPLRAADQAVLLLDWGFAVPAGIDGVGTLVEPGRAAAAATGTTGDPAAGLSIGPGDVTAADAPDGRDSPLLPVALAVGAVVIVGATLAGRRQAMRPGPGGPGGAAAGSRRSPPAPPRSADPRPGAPGTGPGGPARGAPAGRAAGRPPENGSPPRSTGGLPSRRP
jgi:D-alanyl-D-alanine carboxypeptidase (penicillin-binding protein 5/6)